MTAKEQINKVLSRATGYHLTKNAPSDLDRRHARTALERARGAVARARDAQPKSATVRSGPLKNLPPIEPWFTSD